MSTPTPRAGTTSSASTPTPPPTRSGPPGGPPSPTSTRPTAGSAAQPGRRGAARPGRAARRTTPSWRPPTDARDRRPEPQVVTTTDAGAARDAGVGARLAARRARGPDPAGRRRGRRRRRDCPPTGRSPTPPARPGPRPSGRSSRSWPTTAAHLDEPKAAAERLPDRRLPQGVRQALRRGHRRRTPRDRHGGHGRGGRLRHRPRRRGPGAGASCWSTSRAPTRPRQQPVVYRDWVMVTMERSTATGWSPGSTPEARAPSSAATAVLDLTGRGSS